MYEMILPPLAAMCRRKAAVAGPRAWAMYVSGSPVVLNSAGIASPEPSAVSMKAFRSSTAVSLRTSSPIGASVFLSRNGNGSFAATGTGSATAGGLAKRAGGGVGAWPSASPAGDA